MQRLVYLLSILAITLSQKAHATDTLQARRQLDHALALLQSAQFRPAIGQAAQALAIFEKQKPADRLALADCQNTIGRAWLGLENAAAAMPFFQKALAQRQRALGENHPAVANCHNNLGIAAAHLGDLKKALTLHQKALGLRIAAFGECHPDVATSRQNLANCLFLLGQFSEALQHNRLALDIRLDAFGTQHPLVAQSFSASAKCLTQLGGTRQAISFFEKALVIEQAVFEKNDPRTTVTLTAIGSLELDLGVFQKARQHLLTVLNAAPPTAEILDKLGLTWQQEGKYDIAQQYHENALALQTATGDKALAASIHANLGACLLRKKQPGPALENFQKALAIFEKTGNHPLASGQCQMNIGICFFEKKETAQAMAYFEKAGAVFERPETRSPDLLAVCQHHIGQVWQQRGDLHRALVFHEKSLQKLGFQTSKPWSADLAGKALPTLAARASAYLQAARHSPAPAALADARNAYALALQALDLLAANSGGATTRQKLAEHHYPVFEGVIETFFLSWKKTGQHHWLEKAFLLSEKSHVFSQAAPASNATVTVKKLQTNLLDNRSALLEWFVGDSSIFTFLLTKDTLLCFYQKHGFPLQEWASAVRQGIFYWYAKGPKTAEKYQHEYLSHAQLLYQKLLSEPLASMPTSVSRLVFIPDGALHYLPFDALLTGAPLAGAPFQEYPYLMKKYASSVGLSAAQLWSLRNGRHLPAKYSLLAVAPDFRHDSRGLRPLRFNEKETAAAVRIWGGNVLKGKNATLQKFLEMASGFAILHLATHGNADVSFGGTSWLAFSETDGLGSLSADSICLQHLPAQLVILSACETGIGQYRPGEGVAGLSNAFLFAGASSVLSTLWAVDDPATAELTEAFLRHLKAGLPKDIALQKARLDYLAAHPGAEGHPFFWAAFTMVGDRGPIEINARGYWLFWGLAWLVMLFSGWLFFKKTAFFQKKSKPATPRC